MREYQQKRILGIFQSYDMNIDSYPNSSEEGKIQGCTQEKPMLEKTYAVSIKIKLSQSCA